MRFSGFLLTLASLACFAAGCVKSAPTPSAPGAASSSSGANVTTSGDLFAHDDHEGHVHGDEMTEETPPAAEESGTIAADAGETDAAAAGETASDEAAASDEFGNPPAEPATPTEPQPAEPQPAEPQPAEPQPAEPEISLDAPAADAPPQEQPEEKPQEQPEESEN